MTTQNDPNNPTSQQATPRNPTPTNPMETVFVQQVEAINSEMFRLGPAIDDALFASLNNHLSKAQRLGMLWYEGEVQNALALYYFLRYGSAQGIEHMELARACAVKVGALELQMRCDYNIAMTLVDRYEFDAALEYFNDVITNGLAMDPIALAVCFSLSGRMSYYIITSRWQQALQDLQLMDEIHTKIGVTNKTRDSFARATQTIYLRAAAVHIAQQNRQAAISTLNLSRGLAKQLAIPAMQAEHEIQEALYALVFDAQADAYDAWLEAKAAEVDVIENCRILAVLRATEQVERADVLWSKTLERIEDDTLKQRLGAVMA
jgi:hypothetical protein